MSRKRVSRREFLRLGAVAGAGIAFAACQAQTVVVKETVEVEKEKVVKETVVVEKEVEKEVTTVVEKEVTKVVEKEVTKVVEVAPPEFSESPKLAQLVEAGTLPPVDERVPVNPAIVGGRAEIGVYGGEVRQIHMQPEGFTENYGWWAERMNTFSDVDLRTLLPNIIESWEVSDDGKTFTLRLRAGMRWSDGEPLTTEDVLFWYEDFLLNEELTPVVGMPWNFGGEPIEVMVKDDYAFDLGFAAPFGVFGEYLTRFHMPNFLIPKHYMQQFHTDYREKAELDGLVNEGGFDEWHQLFNANNDAIIWNAGADIEYPQISGWVIVDRPQPGLVLLETNPYYWKTDMAGNQLPYIDRVRVDLAVKSEVVTMKIIQGELDYAGPHSVTIARYPLYKEHEATQSYIVGDYISCMADRYVIEPNHTHDDPVLREIINHPDFGKALSVALNRNAINESLYYGLARMGQAGVLPGSRVYEEEFATAWTEYDLDLANELLDEIGLDQRDAEGFRLRPDGERFTFHIEHAGPRVGVSAHEFTELVVDMWRDAGIDASTEELEISLLMERVNNNEVDVSVWHNDRCTDMLFATEPWFHLCIHPRNQAPAWRSWYLSNGQSGEEPPDHIKRRLELYETWMASVDEAERTQLQKELLRMNAERPVMIGAVVECPAPLIFNQNMRNLPRPRVPVGWDTYGISTYHPEAFFYVGGTRA